MHRKAKNTYPEPIYVTVGWVRSCRRRPPVQLQALALSFPFSQDDVFCFFSRMELEKELNPIHVIDLKVSYFPCLGSPSSHIIPCWDLIAIRETPYETSIDDILPIVTDGGCHGVLFNRDDWCLRCPSIPQEGLFIAVFTPHGLVYREPCICGSCCINGLLLMKLSPQLESPNHPSFGMFSG